MGDMNWIDRTEERDMWRAVVSEVKNLQMLLNAGNLLPCYVHISFSGRTLLHGVGWIVLSFANSFFLSFFRSFVSHSVSHVVRNQTLIWFLDLFSDGFQL
jgi:hypothetical protein